MGGRSDSGRPPRRIDAEARALFVADLRAGVARDEAARRRGFSAQAFYGARKRDALFRSAWIWALELSAVDEREARRAASLAAAACGDPIAPNNLRPLQRRRMRGIKFTDERKRMFLDHYTGTADAFAAADAAGIHYSTFYKHYREDPEFAAACGEALAFAYAQLEAEALRQRLEAQRGLREGRIPKGEMAREFDRVMRLLDRYQRRDGRIAMREVRHGRQKSMSFEDAMELLDKRLRNLKIPIAGEESTERDGDPKLCIPKFVRLDSDQGLGSVPESGSTHASRASFENSSSRE